MWLFDTKQAEVKEYDSSAVHAVRGRSKLTWKAHTVPVTPLRLGVALARTLLSRDPMSWDLAFETAGAFFQIQTSIDGRSSDLRLAQGFGSKYRDFSRTGRCGHIAQSLAYLVAQRVLRFPLVIDFEGYIAAEGGNPAQGRGKRPDFVLVKPGTSGIAVMESSGSEGGSIRRLLRKGIAQAANAQGFATAAGVPLPISNRYSFAAVLRDRESDKPTELAFCDPPDHVEPRAFPWRAVHRSYAAWLAFSGHFDMAGYLLDGWYAPLLRRFRKQEVRGRTFLLVRDEFPSSWPWFWPIPISGGLRSAGIHHDVRIGFDEEALTAVVERDEMRLAHAFRSMQQLNEDLGGRGDGSPSGLFELFPDGSVVMSE